MNIKHDESYGRIRIDAEDLYQELLERDHDVATLTHLKMWIKSIIHDYRHKPKEVKSQKG